MHLFIPILTMALLFGEALIRLNLNKLKLLQNTCKAICIVTSSQMSTSSKPLYIISNILSLPKLFEFEIAKIVYFHKFNLLPKIFDNYFSYAKSCHSRTTKFSLKNNLTIPLFKSNRTQRSIKYIGPKIWNSISHNLKIMTFNKLKKNIINQFYFSTIKFIYF